MKILVIEHPAVAGFVAHGLRDHGHTVDVAHDGETGLRLGRTGGYDLILLAVVLPKGNGLEVGAALRRGGSVPILLLTPDDHEAEHFIRHVGANGYLVKPFRFGALLEHVNALDRTQPRPPHTG
ncbi:MAG TPA: response regulator [Gemmatimonadales bacterium]|nr:response regulator [Gemmatimonadales bacterium]